MVAWETLVIGMLGGDEREQEIARLAAATGAGVRAYGFPWPEHGIPGVQHLSDAAAVLKGAKFALFPIPGIGTDGALFAPANPVPIIPNKAMLAGMKQPAHIILGWADDKLKAQAAELSIQLHEYERDRGMTLRRAPAIIEGLLKITIENTVSTIHRARVCVVGQGAIGSLLTRYLIALGACVHVVARSPDQRAAAYVAGAQVHPLEELEALAPRLDILYSTVPSRIVDENILARLEKTALVLDVAAPPGSVDFEAAKKLGRKVIWARGLGRRAPITVGASQWEGIRERIEKIIESEL
jgi:dipicolinate synthase subunit A